MEILIIIILIILSALAISYIVGKEAENYIVNNILEEEE